MKNFDPTHPPYKGTPLKPTDSTPLKSADFNLSPTHPPFKGKPLQSTGSAPLKSADFNLSPTHPPFKGKPLQSVDSAPLKSVDFNLSPTYPPFKGKPLQSVKVPPALPSVAFTVKMLRTFATVIVTLLISMMLMSTAMAAPTFVLMKFTDDTRYDLIESAASLSDLLMEKLIASGKFNLQETYPLDENIEARLYDEKMRELSRLEAAFETGDFNPLFEGRGFDENKAQSIATAQVGQIITPEITAAIGEQHSADYLIQGTIINLGTGGWWNENFERLSDDVNKASALHGMTADMGAISDVMTFDVTKTGVGVQCDVRIIEAATGEVVWSKRVVGVHEQKSFDFLFVTIGNRKLNNNLYAKAMDKAADKIVTALIDDFNAGLLHS